MSCRARANGQRGFTLIEVIVAVAIMALISAIAYRGLASMLDARERLSAQNQRLRDLALTFTRIESDFSAAVARPVRDSYGTEKAAFLGAPTGLEEAGAAIVFTRMGAAGQVGKLADLQRIGYRLKDKNLELLTWPAVDQAPRATPSAAVILDQVNTFELRFLDSKKAWQTQWPQPALGGLPPEALPRAVRVALTLASGETYSRVVLLP